MKVCIVTALLAVAAADKLLPAYQAPSAYRAPAAYSAPAAAYKQPEYEPAPYAFDYTVSDYESGAKFAADENSDGKQTSGYYTVALPDGRVQTVKYTVDKYAGYNAEVTYEGEAQYPEEPVYKAAPAPVYKAAPAPVYKAAPAPAPVYKAAPAPVYKAAPAPAPVYKAAPAPAPVYKAAPAPIYKPAPAPAPFYKAAPALAPVYAYRPIQKYNN